MRKAFKAGFGLVLISSSIYSNASNVLSDPTKEEKESLDTLFRDFQEPKTLNTSSSHQNPETIVSDASSENSYSGAAADITTNIASADSMKKKESRYSLYGEMLYWKVADTSTAWGEKENTINSANPTSEKYFFDFDWDFGFRLGANFRANWNDLITDINWTRFHTKSTNYHQDSAIVDNISTIYGFGIKYNLTYLPSPLYSYGNPWKVQANYTFDFDQIDLVFKKPIGRGKRFTFTPFGGVRSIIMRYILNSTRFSDYWGDTEVTQPPFNSSITNVENSLFSVGLVAGLHGKLQLGRGFDYFMSGSGFIGGGRSKSSNYSAVYLGSTTPTNTMRTKATSNVDVKAMIDITTGFGWEREIWQDKLALNVNASYEFHMIFNSPKFIYNSNYLGTFADPTSNTVLQGLTINMGLNF